MVRIPILFATQLHASRSAAEPRDVSSKPHRASELRRQVNARVNGRRGPASDHGLLGAGGGARGRTAPGRLDTVCQEIGCNWGLRIFRSCGSPERFHLQQHLSLTKGPTFDKTEVGSKQRWFTICCQTKQEIELLDLILKNSSIYDKRITPTAHHGIAQLVFLALSLTRMFAFCPTICLVVHAIIATTELCLPAAHQHDIVLNEPTEVICNIDIRSLWSLSHQTMDFQTDMYLYQHWYDWRLVDKRFTRAIDFNDPEIIKAIWKPDIYFPNAKSGNFQNVAVPNVLLRLDQDGKVTLMFRLTMKFSCMMELVKYPFDNQTCLMEISTFAKTEKELVLKWREEEPIRLHPKLAQLPNFEIVRPTAEECDEVYAMGKYSCLEANLLLYRRRGYHIVQNYIPTILIVVISWVSFWMDVDAVPGRISLGITTLLTVTAKVTGVQQKLPEVSYIKAIDVWMGTCTAMVFCALFEFILANYRHRREKNKAKQYQMVQATKTDTAAPETPGLVNAEIQLYTISGKKVDQIARIAFPVVFFIFNIIYWCFYLT